jgi:hypothetical protein
MKLLSTFSSLKGYYQKFIRIIEHNITNIILVDASEGLNGSRVEAHAKGDIRVNVICLIFA